MADTPTVVPTSITPAAEGSQNVTVDYKAEFEKAEKQLKQAEHVIVSLKKESKDTPPAVDVEKIKQELTQEIEQKNEQFRQSMVADALEEELARVTTNDDERKLIRLYYDKSIVKSGYSRAQIASDLANAKLLANKPLYEKQLSETKAALQSATGRSSGSAASVKIEPAIEGTVTLNAQERELVQRVATRRKISFEEAAKLFKK